MTVVAAVLESPRLLVVTPEVPGRVDGFLMGHYSAIQVIKLISWSQAAGAVANPAFLHSY